jgi:hypothetical protein
MEKPSTLMSFEFSVASFVLVMRCVSEKLPPSSSSAFSKAACDREYWACHQELLTDLLGGQLSVFSGNLCVLCFGGFEE